DRTIFLGDLVINEAEDNGATLAGQLDAWEAAFKVMPGADRSALLPVAGNHELNTYSMARKAQAPNPSMYDAWLAWTLRNGHEPPVANGPGPSGANPDMLVRDESRMSFSFNIRSVHVVVLNTDSLSTQIDSSVGLPVPGWIPINWVEADLLAAQADLLVSAIVVMGHRPIEGMPGAGYNPGNSIHNDAAFPLADRLAEVMRENDKARLYIASHMHATDLRRIEGGKGVWQFISGNGGAPFEGDWKPPGGPYFWFAVVNFYPGGEVGVVLYRRPPPSSPQKFYEDTPVPPPPATPDPEIILD
ncbi:MAG: metallophosphoesterase family protein, partial [Syntrophales bacterium]